MRIVELTNFSAGICGVGTRVKQEANLLADRGHKVIIISSDHTKGSPLKASPSDKEGKIQVYRVGAVKLGGESFLRWDWISARTHIISFKPDILIAHAYRHLHTLFALRIGRELNIPVFLVTHAPFVEKNTTRSLFAKLAVLFYDSPLGPRRRLVRFEKIIAITRWEIPLLKKLGVPQKKIAYIPNGLDEKFFAKKKNKSSKKKKILFLGRVSPIKSLETLIKAISLMKTKGVALEIVGPREEAYFEKLKHLVKECGVKDKVIFSEPIFEVPKKIEKIDESSVFVLPSLREAMPQSLIEAMARGKIVVASDNPGSRDLISSGKTGYLFKVGDASELAKRLDFVLKSNLSKVSREAQRSVEKFRWTRLIKDLESVLALKK